MHRDPVFSPEGLGHHEREAGAPERIANDDDLNEQASCWLEGTANVRRHGTTGERPVDRFERDERGALRPLARRPYLRLGARPIVEQARRRVPETVEVERRSLRVYAEVAR